MTHTLRIDRTDYRTYTTSCACGWTCPQLGLRPAEVIAKAHKGERPSLGPPRKEKALGLLSKG